MAVITINGFTVEPTMMFDLDLAKAQADGGADEENSDTVL